MGDLIVEKLMDEKNELRNIMLLVVGATGAVENDDSNINGKKFSN